MSETTPRMYSPLQDAIADLRSIRERRKDFESQVKQYKAKEAELTNTIMTMMGAEGIVSANFDGLGSAIISDKVHYEIVDAQAFALYNIRKMVEAFQSGGVLTDGLFLQRTISRAAIEAQFDGEAVPENECIIAGIRRVVEPTLSIRTKK